MNRTFLMAAVAAIAITAPAQAERGGKHGNQDPAAAQAQPAAPEQQRGGGRQQRQQAHQQAPQVQQQQRARPERQVFQQQRIEQRARPERQVFQQQRMEQRVRPERQVFQQRARPERQVFQQQRVQQRARPERQMVQQQRQAERLARPQNQMQNRIQNRIERQARAPEFRGQQSTQRAEGGNRAFQQQMKQQRQADRFAGMQQRIDQRSARFDARTAQRAQFDGARMRRPQAEVGQRLTTQALATQAVDQNWYNDYAAQRYSSLAAPSSYYNYNSNDGYLYQVNRDNSLVTAMFPLLGGAFGAGQMLPYGYQNYNVPYGYQSLYYDTPDYNYRYGDGAIYQVNPNTGLIQAVVALLTGSSFGVGQMLPMGYDVYNVPYGYRDQYYDTADNWYRYDNGMIYQVDPYSRMIESAYPMSYGGYQVGYPAPTYAGYGYPSYGVPYGYQDLYYADPGYNYQYANGGIYQVDPTTQLVSALVALVSGQNLGIGQTLPLGYDAYNVPYAYRSSYNDTPSRMYRYDDGTIYGVDPRTRVIESAIPVAYDGFMVGYPVPAGYAGYAVPPLYSDLYYPQQGFDYRYANGGIYQIDPKTQTVEAIAALLTGQSFGVGQMMPAGYDAYNVPYAYRDQYADTADNMYRYADGSIYRVDPQSRVIQAVIDAVA